MSGDDYLLLAYVVVLAAVLVYLVIHSLRLSRLERELAELAALARRPDEATEREEVGVGR